MASSSSSETFPSPRVEKELGLTPEERIRTKLEGSFDVWLVQYGPPSQTDPNNPATWHSGVGVTTVPEYGKLAINKKFKTETYVFSCNTAQKKLKLAYIADKCRRNPKEFGQWVHHCLNGNETGTSLYLLRALELRPDTEGKVIGVPLGLQVTVDGITLGSQVIYNALPRGSLPLSKFPFKNVGVEHILGMVAKDRIGNEFPDDEPDQKANFWAVEYAKEPLVLDGRYESGVGVTRDIKDAQKACSLYKTSSQGSAKFKSYLLDHHVDALHYPGLVNRLLIMANTCNQNEGIMFGMPIPTGGKSFDEDKDCNWTSRNLNSAMERAEAERDKQPSGVSNENDKKDAAVTLLSIWADTRSNS